MLSLSAKPRIRSNKQLLFDHLTCSRELNRAGIRIDPGLRDTRRSGLHGQALGNVVDSTDDERRGMGKKITTSGDRVGCRKGYPECGAPIRNETGVTPSPNDPAKDQISLENTDTAASSRRDLGELKPLRK